MIVDVHGHLGPWFFFPSEGTAAENLRVMDTHGIDVQLVSSVEAVTYDPAAGNAALAGAIGDEPRLRGLFVIDPRDLAAAEQQLDELRGSFVGAKIHTHYSATPAGSPAMADALRVCADADLPALVHTWGTEILDLADTVASVPGARAIAGHMGGPAWRLAPEALTRTDRLWLEPCYSRPDAGRVRWVLDRVDPRRMLFGTDSTLIDPALAFGAIRAAHLSAEEERLVMSANAIDLFGLDLWRGEEPPTALHLTGPLKDERPGANGPHGVS